MDKKLNKKQLAMEKELIKIINSLKPCPFCGRMPKIETCEGHNWDGKQRRWQLRMKNDNRCQQCGEPSGGKAHCPSCSVKSREAVRKRNNFKAKVEGGRGRPQIY